MSENHLAWFRSWNHLWRQRSRSLKASSFKSHKKEQTWTSRKILFCTLNNSWIWRINEIKSKWIWNPLGLRKYFWSSKIRFQRYTSMSVLTFHHFRWIFLSYFSLRSWKIVAYWAKCIYEIWNLEYFQRDHF